MPCNTEDKKKITVQFLDDYATRQFEAILHYMVGTRNEIKPSEGVIHLLVNSGLMERQ